MSNQILNITSIVKNNHTNLMKNNIVSRQPLKLQVLSSILRPQHSIIPCHRHSCTYLFGCNHNMPPHPIPRLLSLCPYHAMLIPRTVAHCNTTLIKPRVMNSGMVNEAICSLQPQLSSLISPTYLCYASG